VQFEKVKSQKLITSDAHVGMFGNPTCRRRRVIILRIGELCGKKMEKSGAKRKISEKGTGRQI